MRKGTMVGTRRRRCNGGPGPERAKQGLDEARVILDEHRHMIAVTNAKRAQAVRDPVCPQFELGVSQAMRPIDERLLPRPSAERQVKDRAEIHCAPSTGMLLAAPHFADGNLT